METRPSMEDIKRIRQATGCDLLDALVIFAKQLPDYRLYSGPMKQLVLDRIRRELEKEKAESKFAEEVRKIRRETGCGLYDAIRLAREKFKKSQQ